MNPVIRSSIAALATFAACWYVYWVPFEITLESGYGRFPWIWIIRVLGSLANAGFVGQYTWRHKSLAPQGLVSWVIAGAVVMGGVGFSAGWYGPMVFDPGSQGPLLGIVTGPLGFLVGAIGGALYWELWGREKRKLSDVRTDDTNSVC